MTVSNKIKNKIISELEIGMKSIYEIAKENRLSKSTIYKISSQLKKTKKSEKHSNDQLCWTCAKAYGGCSWSSCFEPVDGWVATPTIINRKSGRPVNTYHISECPEYEAE